MLLVLSGKILVRFSKPLDIGTFQVRRRGPCLENPGPAHHTLEDHSLEDWELVEVVTEMEELKTKCAVCGIGDVRPVTRSIEGHQSMIINTRNGPRRVKHVLMRCNRVQSSSWAWILSDIGPQDI